MHATETQARLLRAAVHAAAGNPEAFDMSLFVDIRTGEAGACGTVGCLAGWVVRNEIGDVAWGQLAADAAGMRQYRVASHARELLGLDELDSERLFFVENWPTAFRPDGYTDTTGPRYLDDTLATVDHLRARVEHWIETGE